MSDQSERDWSEHLRIQLAAEVEKVNKLQQQLAAEREQLSAVTVALTKADTQLAAEREDHHKAVEFAAAEIEKEHELNIKAALSAADKRCWEAAANVTELEQQLAAEREKVESLTEVLSGMTEHHANFGVRQERDEALKQLAAEREQWQLATEECHRIISRKNEELAAEREQGVKALAERSFELHECQKQLAVYQKSIKVSSELAVSSPMNNKIEGLCS